MKDSQEPYNDSKELDAIEQPMAEFYEYLGIRAILSQAFQHLSQRQHDIVFGMNRITR